MTLRKKFYPWASVLPKKFSVTCATLFGLGNLSAPGTWGSVVGILFYCLFFQGMPIFRYAVFALLVAYIAIGICDAAERHLQKRDPREIVLDEFVAVPICFLPITVHYFNGWWIFAGFLLFRILDIKKPLWINDMQSLEGGAGCVMDDVIAALAVALAMNLLAIIIQ